MAAAEGAVEAVATEMDWVDPDVVGALAAAAVAAWVAEGRAGAVEVGLVAAGLGPAAGLGGAEAVAVGMGSAAAREAAQGRAVAVAGVAAVAVVVVEAAVQAKARVEEGTRTRSSRFPVGSGRR